ncbi:hypothetical protein V5O48_009102 [Marasmius crinis-equi]|uniref:Uncharacterized protein n=1 Tax=Marasmius crinis-equi TaxID=585013 RepID=A0ABR3FC86_9AGAR
MTSSGDVITSYSPGATTQASESATQTESAVHTPVSSESRSNPRGPIIGATLGSLFGLGGIIFALWFFYVRKRRQEIHAQRPVPNVLELIVDRFSFDRDEKTRPISPILPLSLSPAPAPDISADTRTAPPARGTSTIPDEISSQTRSGIIAGLTTDELVLELNQRIRVDEQWNDSETLPEYPGSERGGV